MQGIALQLKSGSTVDEKDKSREKEYKQEKGR
jgi:hypothetical protein